MNQTSSIDQVTTLADPVTGEIVSTLTDEQFIGVLAAAQQEAKEATDRHGMLVLEGLQRAAAIGATTLYGKSMNFVVTQANEYDRTKLPPLLELLDPEAKGKCFIPAHPETVDVPDKWDMTQVKKYAKARGNEALDIVERATFPGRASGKLVEPS